MRARGLGSFGVALVAVALIGVTFATDARAQVPTATKYPSDQLIAQYPQQGYVETWFGVSGGVNAITTKFEGRGSANGTAGVVCLDAEERWGGNLRYAGEFSGFRLAVTGSVCEGIGHTSQPVDVFTGQTTIGTQFMFGGKIGYPIPINRIPVTLYVVGGLSYTDLTVKAVPFESGSGWKFGSYIGGEASLPIDWGKFTWEDLRNPVIREMFIDAIYDPLKLTLSGGAHTSTTMMVYKVGLRARY
jgi:hypothetical protein